jgi:hypothetical protein
VVSVAVGLSMVAGAVAQLWSAVSFYQSLSGAFGKTESDSTSRCTRGATVGLQRRHLVGASSAYQWRRVV